MKINLGISAGYLWKKLQEEWGNDFEEIRKLVLDGIARGLKPLENQFKLVLEREHIEGETAFKCWLQQDEKTMLYVQIYFWPLKRDEEKTNFPRANYWFILGEPFKIVFSPPTPKFMLDISVMKTYAFDRARCIASDVARDGLPKKLKRAIHETQKWSSKYDSSLSFDFFINRS